MKRPLRSEAGAVKGPAHSTVPDPSEREPLGVRGLLPSRKFACTFKQIIS